MTIRGKIVDSVTLEPLPNASVTVVDKVTGKSLGQGIAAGKDGQFALTSNLLDQSYTAVLVSYVDHESLMIEPKLLEGGDYPQIGLLLNADLLDAVTVTPANNKNNSWLIWFLLAFGATVFVLDHAHDKRKKRKSA